MLGEAIHAACQPPLLSVPSQIQKGKGQFNILHLPPIPAAASSLFYQIIPFPMFSSSSFLQGEDSCSVPNIDWSAQFPFPLFHSISCARQHICRSVPSLGPNALQLNFQSQAALNSKAKTAQVGACTVRIEVKNTRATGKSKNGVFRQLPLHYHLQFQQYSLQQHCIAQHSKPPKKLGNCDARASGIIIQLDLMPKLQLCPATNS